MSLVRTKGIVIKIVNTGEADRILTVFTGTHGKLQAAAKGARRPKNKLMPGTQFLCYSDFVLFKGRTLYSVNSSEPIETFFELRNDIVRLTHASYMADLIYDSIQEEQSSQSILSLFLNSLYMLNKSEKLPSLITRTFELRLLSELGFAPAADACGDCGIAPKESAYFSFRKGTVLCTSCANSSAGDIPVRQGTLKAMQHIIYSEPEELFRFELTQLILDELGRLIDRLLCTTMDKNYKKLDYLKCLELD